MLAAWPRCAHVLVQFAADEVEIKAMEAQLKAYDDLQSMKRPQGPMLVETARVGASMHGWHRSMCHVGKICVRVARPQTTVLEEQKVSAFMTTSRPS